MKKIILLGTVFIGCLLLDILTIQAQTLYGTSPRGIIKFNAATNDLKVVKSLDPIAANPLYSNFIEAADGKLYGMTSWGGDRGEGVILSFDPASSTYSVLKSFTDSSTGISPSGSLIQTTNGMLYGMATGGWPNGSGVIFSFDPSSFKYTKLKDFNNTDGAYPHGSLLLASNGKLYGMTTDGGANDVGVIFSFDPVTLIYTKLIDFDNANGKYPGGSLVEIHGKLYGVANGGSKNFGVIFSFDLASSVYKKLKDFDNTNGASPAGSLVVAGSKLYGVTSDGGENNDGTIFSFDPGSSVFTKLEDLSPVDGYRPRSGLSLARDGKLYGMTNFGGNSDFASGVIFSFDPSNSTYSKLKEFNGPDGNTPLGGLIQARDGKLYGMTSKGGFEDAGVIFSLDPITSSYMKLKDLAVAENGHNISGSVIQGTDGNLYGMTSEGGRYNAGVIFLFQPSSSTYIKLKDFDNTNGAAPYGSLIKYSNGKFYGTAGGGTFNKGVIFSFDPSSLT